MTGALGVYRKRSVLRMMCVGRPVDVDSRESLTNEDKSQYQAPEQLHISTASTISTTSETERGNLDSSIHWSYSHFRPTT